MERRKLIGNAGCLIRVYGLVSTCLFLGRAAVLILFSVRPMCCGNIDDSADCLDVSGVNFAFVLCSQWLPDIVPTGLMMHLMWSSGATQRPASLKSLRLSKIIDRSRVPISGTRAQTTSKGRRSHNPEIRTARLSKRASLREGLLQAASMESADFESKHRHGNHIIRSDSQTLQVNFSKFISLLPRISGIIYLAHPCG